MASNPTTRLTISDASAADWAWRSPAYAWWVVILLALGLTLALADRLIIALMIEPIKHDLSLSDTQVSLVHGLAFTITYVVAGLPFGRFADRGHRVRLGASSIFCWSLMTGLCGGATSFGLLFAARLGVGVGEAGLSPVAVSLVADYFPPDRRAQPLAFLSIGTTAGAGLALMAGGLIVQAIGSSPTVTLPGFGAVRAWQAIFLVLGMAGIVFTLLFTTIREPLRREVGSVTQASVPDVLSFIRSRRRFLVPVFFGPAFAVLTLIAFHSWMPTMLMRRFGWAIGRAGLAYGAVMTLSGIAGIVLAGRISQVLASRGQADAPLRVAMISAAAAGPILVLAPLLPTASLTLAALFFGLALAIVPSTLAPAALQAVVPNEMRGQVFAIYLLVMSFLGYAIGPLLVAVLTDDLFARTTAVNDSLAMVAALAMPVAALCGRRAVRAFNRSE